MGPVLYCGDPHGRLQHIVHAAMEMHASAVVLLGDVQSPRPLHVELEPIAHMTWFIHGNHDTDSEQNWSHMWGSKLAERNIDGRVMTLPDGTRLAGLGGVFRESVWYPTASAARGGSPAYRTRSAHAKATSPKERWQHSVPLKHWSTIYPDEVDRLADKRADVLILHEAPGYHPNGFDLLDTLAQSIGARVVSTVIITTTWIARPAGRRRASNLSVSACAALPPSTSTATLRSSCQASLMSSEVTGSRAFEGRTCVLGGTLLSALA